MRVQHHTYGWPDNASKGMSILLPWALDRKKWEAARSLDAAADSFATVVTVEFGESQAQTGELLDAVRHSRCVACLELMGLASSASGRFWSIGSHDDLLTFALLLTWTS